ncbi:MAG: sigma-70 family RNA polymerase sigma factor [Isosphaeraceae bacterium]
MNSKQTSFESAGLAGFEQPQIKMLSAAEERSLLVQLADCKAQLGATLARMEGIDVPAGGDDPQSLAQFIASTCTGDGLRDARLGAIHRRYLELRARLAMANIRLVAHVAKRFRDRGIPYAELLQEGFCGLLEAIDRFSLNHETRLATYATWWIRQSIQQAVASGAYPVRLTPRHLRQLARNQEEAERSEPGTGLAEEGSDSSAASEMIRRIQAATRPTLSLDAAVARDSSFSLRQTLTDHRVDHMDDVDSDAALGKLLNSLSPRERRVLSLRFGLEGQARCSLSQVGRILEVSKERVRQIQDRALARLRSLAEKENLSERLALMV